MPRRKRSKPRKNKEKAPLRKKRKIVMEQHRCPISLEPIPPKYLFTIQLGDPPKDFHYDVRELLAHVERRGDPSDPLTRISYTKEQVEKLRASALEAGIKPLCKTTLRRIWHIDGIFKMIKTQVCYHAQDDLYLQINQFIENTTTVLRDQDDVADTKQSREIWSSIRDEANKLEREICAEWNRRNNEELDREEEEKKNEEGEESESEENEEDVEGVEGVEGEEKSLLNNAILEAIQNQNHTQLINFMRSALQPRSRHIHSEPIILSSSGFPIYPQSTLFSSSFSSSSSSPPSPSVSPPPSPQTSPPSISSLMSSGVIVLPPIFDNSPETET